VLRHQADTVLADYLVQSALLAGGVAVGVMLLGSATAAAVTLFDFPLRRSFEWALLLPLAMPAYVLAYADRRAAVQPARCNRRCVTPSACRGRCGPTCAACGVRWCCSCCACTPMSTC
jgi:hypothetical protein